MKNVLCALSCLLFVFFTAAQNVGIGTTQPTELLDVKGNINLSGVVKANGTAGKANQVLATNGTGNMVWADLCGYNNFIGISYSQTWIVPAGVTKIVAELWGAGGGGNANGGGGSGGYGRAQFDVTPGQSIPMVIGPGGQFGTGSASGSNGGETTITPLTSSLSLAVAGGWGATSYPGSAFGFSGSTGTFNYYILNGEYGRFNEESYAQSGASTFLHIIKYGRGGNAPCTTGTGGEGGYSVINENTGIVSTEFGGRQGVPAGGGGGGGRNYGGTGAYGMIIIHY